MSVIRVQSGIARKTIHEYDDGKPEVPDFPTPITKEWAEAKGRWWQERLRLHNWEIEYKVLPMKDMDGNFGMNDASNNRKFAHIYLLDQDTKEKAGDITRYDPEVTIVHELLHCHFNSLDIKEALKRNYEFVIEALSVALVSLKRGGEPVDIFVRTMTSPREITEAEKLSAKD